MPNGPKVIPGADPTFDPYGKKPGAAQARREVQRRTYGLSYGDQDVPRKPAAAPTAPRTVGVPGMGRRKPAGGPAPWPPVR